MEIRFTNVSVLTVNQSYCFVKPNTAESAIQVQNSSEN